MFEGTYSDALAEASYDLSKAICKHQEQGSMVVSNVQCNRFGRLGFRDEVANGRTGAPGSDSSYFQREGDLRRREAQERTEATSNKNGLKTQNQLSISRGSLVRGYGKGFDSQQIINESGEHKQTEHERCVM